VRLNLIGTAEYPLDFDKPLEPKLLEVGLDGDVVIGRFYISKETVSASPAGAAVVDMVAQFRYLRSGDLLDKIEENGRRCGSGLRE